MRKVTLLFLEIEWVIRLVKETWPILLLAYGFLAGGPCLLLWRYAQMMAFDVGWWV